MSNLRGKCENIHGHSMWVELEMLGKLNNIGIMSGIEYGDLKQVFRHYLDTELDHHLLLNKDDPWAQALMVPARAQGEIPTTSLLPGLQVCTDDPTTENLAKWIGEWAFKEFSEGLGIQKIHIVVHETAVNLATWTVECRG